MESPLVSVFIPYYNDKDFIADAIKSCLSQTYQNWELFLFNHASTDGSREIAHSFDDPRIRHIDAAENLGAGSGYNLKITLPMMNGKYAKLLCADDMMLPICLQRFVDYMENNQEKDFAFSDMDYVDEKGKKLNTKWSLEKYGVNFDNDEKETLKLFFRGYSHLAYPTSFIKKAFLKKLDINETFIMLFDVSLWVDALCKGGKIGFVKESTVLYRCSGKQMSSVKNATIASKRGYFELFKLSEYYFKIKNVSMVKHICPSDFAQSLSQEDEEFIPFVLADFWLNAYHCINYYCDQVETRIIVGYQKLFDLMENEAERKKIEQRFGFKISDFRALYSYLPPEKSLSVTQRILLKPGKKLSLMQLLYLLARKIARFPLHLFLKKHNDEKTEKKQSKYTV